MKLNWLVLLALLLPLSIKAEPKVVLVSIDGVRWQEVFAPQDIISSGRFDAGVLPGALSGKIKLQSALLREALAPEEYHKMVLQFFTLHLQYLRASGTGYGFDYFQLLAQTTPAFSYQPRRATTGSAE